MRKLTKKLTLKKETIQRLALPAAKGGAYWAPKWQAEGDSVDICSASCICTDYFTCWVCR